MRINQAGLEAIAEHQAEYLDNGYLTTLRTALAGALAAKHLAPRRVETVAVFGAGSQARWQVRALRLVRDFRRLLVHARAGQRAAECAAELGEELGIAAEAADSGRAAVAEAQLAVTTTPATQPLLQAAWLHPGLHITAMGADAGHKNEIEPAVWRTADVAVCDLRAQCRERGELRHALAAGELSSADGVGELGDVITGRIAGRGDNEQISLCDLTGVGVQDTAIACLARRRIAGG